MGSTPEPAPKAEATSLVELKNGDSFDLRAGFVDKKIGDRSYRMLVYNGSIPGPTIKVAQGAEITINLTNLTGIDTSLHSHGVRASNEYDGATGLTQKPIAVGDTFTYKLRFPDAGVYWYHPHLREDYAQELGLYGNFLVTPATVTYWSPVNREVPLFLDDILIENGAILLNPNRADHLVMGRYGNVMLVNGETDYALSVKKGEVIRFFVTNSANVRPFNVAISGVRIKRVGGDSGAYEHDAWSDGVIVAPSEQVVIEALFEKAGTFEIQNKTPDKIYTLGKIVVSDNLVETSYAAGFATLKTHEETVSSIDPFRQDFSKAVDKTIILTMGMGHGMMGHNMMGSSCKGDQAATMLGGPMMGPTAASSADGIEWEDNASAMNGMGDMGMMSWQIVDQATGRRNMDIAWNFHAGDKVKIRIVNDPNAMHAMQHPIHFHGQRVLMISENGKVSTDLVWKDTVLVPAGATIDVLLDVLNPGNWMAHCHIAEHLEGGMMFAYVVR